MIRGLSGLEHAMNDAARSGKLNSITDEEKAWITNIACTRPNDLGRVQEQFLPPASIKRIKTPSRSWP